MTRILVLDEVVVKPGLGQSYKDIYGSRYVPAAELRGMRLEGSWQHPPVQDFEELETTLYYLWSLEDVKAWWRMRQSRTPEGHDERYAKQAFWQESDQLTVRRSRRFLSDQPGKG